MSKYSCERSEKEFSQKSHYDSHKRRKKPCGNHSNKIQTMVDKKVKTAVKNFSWNQFSTLELDKYKRFQNRTKTSS